MIRKFSGRMSRVRLIASLLSRYSRYFSRDAPSRNFWFLINSANFDKFEGPIKNLDIKLYKSYFDTANSYLLLCFTLKLRKTLVQELLNTSLLHILLALIIINIYIIKYILLTLLIIKLFIQSAIHKLYDYF